MWEVQNCDLKSFAIKISCNVFFAFYFEINYNVLFFDFTLLFFSETYRKETPVSGFKI